jgi:hypothetical protein
LGRKEPWAEIVTTQLWIAPYARFSSFKAQTALLLTANLIGSHCLRFLPENVERNLDFIQLWQNNMYILENDLLSTEIQTSVTFSPLKFAILKSFWGANILSQTTINNELQLEPYFSYYSKQCHLMLGDGGRHIAARRHHDISNIVQLFNERKTLEETVDTIRSNILHLNLPDEEDMILGSINLAARLYLMMSFGEIPNAHTPERALSWPSASIQDFLKQHLEPRRVLGSTSVKLQKIFNARNIQRLARIKIEWTSDLGQHLRMIHDDERVAIFHNSSFLRLHQRGYVNPNSNNFPFQFLKYTK